MKKVQFSERPELVINEGSNVLVCFDVEEVEVTQEAMDGGDGASVTVYEAYAVRVGHPVTRSRVVDAIVRAAYPVDEMEAITNNVTAVVRNFFKQLVGSGIITATKYLTDNLDASDTSTFDEMQEWRKTAKSVADEVVAVMKG